MKIAIAQINPKAGDLQGNSAKIIEFTRRAGQAGAELAVFPECALTGYPAWDLWEDRSFIEANLKTLDAVAAKTGKTAALFGYVDFNREAAGKRLLNCAALAHEGRITARRAKTLLPTYDVFDEARYFESAAENLPVEFNGRRLGVTICEDVWNEGLPRKFYRKDPVNSLVKAGLDAVINLSASPFFEGKAELRRRLIGAHAKKSGVPFIYCNQTGGNDDLVFDGGSFAVDAHGALLARAKPFAEELLPVDTAAASLARDSQALPDEELFLALTTGIRDYLSKCGIKKAVLGLSGGVDSAVVCALAARAIGGGNVTGVSLPSQYTSPESRRDAAELARKLGVKFHEIPITPVFGEYTKALATVFAGRKPDATEENIQARIRGGILMALSNKSGALLLSTGNKSEIAVGYCTLYGDMCGGLAPLADVVKTRVYALARYINERFGGPIPEYTLTRPPSAELRPGQTDQDELPPYDILDSIVKAYVEEGKTHKEIAALGIEAALVLKILDKIDCSEFKRKQAAIGIKVTPKAFGGGRRMPVARGNHRTEKP
ncbi:MAG: NAD+ synthase [Elusimicrobiales bacterium]|nr:NAD+ synthase [Elusimicrobiales bacterium]